MAMEIGNDGFLVQLESNVPVFSLYCGSDGAKKLALWT